jgi:hypothetical protein
MDFEGHCKLDDVKRANQHCYEVTAAAVEESTPPQTITEDSSDFTSNDEMVFRYVPAL